MNSIVALVGRILLASLFLAFGIRKILYFAGNAAYIAKVGFPAPEVMTVIALIFEVGGGLLLVLGWKTRFAAWALALFTVIATIAAHRFWEADAAQYIAQFTNFTKNVAILGGLMMVAAFGPGSISVDKA